ncbi:6-phosphofructokinase [candidate division KSB1 bacterium]
MKVKRIGILTGGGDVPGLNTVIHDVSLRCHYEGIELVGIKRGWGGLIYMDPDGQRDESEHIENLMKSSVRKIDRTGGTILHTSRTNPLNVSYSADLERYRGIKLEKSVDMTDDVLKNLERLGIDALIAIGGDDTLSYAAHLDKCGFNVIGIPKTMDNDINGTEYCIGFSTAISKSMNILNDLRTPMGSHERYGIVELFGRNAGFTALYTGYVSREVRVLIPEFDFDPDHLVELMKRDRKNNPTNYAVVIVSEGAKPAGGDILESGPKDQYGHKKLGGIGNVISDIIKDRTGYLTIVQQLAYFMRSGAPDAVDKLVAGFFGNMAMDCIVENNYGLLTAIKEGRYATVPIGLVTENMRVVDVERYYNTERYRPIFKNIKGLPLFLQ